jgi:signal transduction histidine kinase
VCEAWQQCIAEKKLLFESSHRLLVKDVVVWVSVKAVPIAVDETLSGYLGAVEDVTEQVEAERRKLELALEREKVDMLESFITNASHDLRTPLTIISTGVSLLEKTVEPEKRQKRLQKINTQIERVRWLLDEMLTMSWLDNTELTFDPRPCDLNALVESILSDQSLLAEMKQLTVQFEAADVPPLRANQGVLRRALSNIVINAVDYTPEGGTITVMTCVEDGRVGIIVRDTGDGIADKDLPHIFERFYRADEARSLEKGGMGLGLSIAQKIIGAHNGSIQVETTVGAGSVFTVWLPVNTP